MPLEKLAFWLLYGGLLAAPYCLLLFGKRAGDSRAAARDVPVEEELKAARWLALAAALVPVLQMLLASLASWKSNILVPILWAALPFASLLSGLGATALFFVFARGRERISGPCAALWACVLGVLGFFGGMTAA